MIDHYTTDLSDFVVSLRPLGQVKGQLMWIELRLGNDLALESLHVKYYARAMSFEIPIRHRSTPRLTMGKQKVSGCSVRPDVIALWAASVALHDLTRRLLQIHPSWQRPKTATFKHDFCCYLQYGQDSYSHAALGQWIERTVVRQHPLLLTDPATRAQVAATCFAGEPLRKSFVALFSKKTYRCYDFGGFTKDLRKKAHTAVVDHILGQFRKVRKPGPIELLRFGVERKRWCQPDFVQAVQSAQDITDKATRFSLFYSPYRTNDSNLPRTVGDDFLLAGFVQRHGLNPKGFEWPASKGLLRLIARYELHATVGKLFEGLTANRRMQFAERPKAGVGDELDWVEGMARYRASISKQVKTVLPDPAMRDDFAALCYRDRAGQEWLRSC